LRDGTPAAWARFLESALRCRDAARSFGSKACVPRLGHTAPAWVVCSDVLLARALSVAGAITTLEEEVGNG